MADEKKDVKNQDTKLQEQEKRNESTKHSEWKQKKDEEYKKHKEEVEHFWAMYKKWWFFYRMYMWKLNSWKHYAMLSFDRWNDMTPEDQDRKTNVVTPFTYILCKSLYEKIYWFKHEADVLIEWPKKTENKAHLEWGWEIADVINQNENDEEKEMSEDKSVEKRLNKIVESSELVSQYSDIIESFIVHWSSRVRLSFNFEEEYFATKEKNKENIARKKPMENYTTEMFDTTLDVYEPYNFIYDQRKRNVYKSSFFQYINYEPLDEVLSRWAIFLDEKEINDIKENMGKWGLALGMPDFKRYRELEAVDDYLINNNEKKMKKSWFVWEQASIVKLQYNDTFEYLSKDILETDYLVQEHYSKDYITLYINDTVIKVVKNIYSKHSKGNIYHPYVQFNITNAPHKTLNKSVPERLSTLQKLNDMIYNWFSDQMKMALAPMYQSDGSIQFSDNWIVQDYVQYSPYKIIETMWWGKLTRMDLWEVNSSILTIMDFIQGMWQIITSITRYTWGGKQWVERSATGADLMADITNDAVRPTHYGMADSTNRIFKVAMILTKEFLWDKIEIDKDQIIDLSSITKIKDFQFGVTFKSDSVTDLLETKYINKVATILQTLRPEIVQMANLPDGPFIKLRTIFTELFKRIDEKEFVFNDEEVNEYIERIKIINENQRNIEAAQEAEMNEQKVNTDSQQSVDNAEENNVNETTIDFNNL